MEVKSDKVLDTTDFEAVVETDTEAQQIINRVQMIVENLFDPNNPFSASSVRANVMPFVKRLRSMGKKSEAKDLVEFAMERGLDLGE